MSHSKSLGSPVNSKASLIGADPASLNAPEADDSQPSASASPEQASAPDNSILQKVSQWVDTADLPQSLTDLPSTLKAAGSKTKGRWQQLSTTEKVVGGVLLVAGLRFLFTRR